MRKIKRLVAMIAAGSIVALSSGAAVAEDKEQGSGPQPFTECGIGAALFPETHWAAVTSNIIWDVGTTAVISATASPETCNGKSAQAAKLIHDTYDNILEDTAKGDGEYVVALMQVYGCSVDSHDDLINAVRTNFSATVSKDGYVDMSKLEKAEAYFNVIDAEVRSDFAASCSA